ncbi:protein serine/threonine phosphatase 2C [Massarina eburnea CBS 473.64]|uniref:Protein serine/threonine phosphatase 2C n=1 Tax=Massarina eburnea CBS 473.64 TaxID=1395130 RepID=A0A6A6S6S8_9PLEO|nr:protein serine/threonine phosphatase 2C [Massarina eburnea CBS 473.64]
MWKPSIRVYRASRRPCAALRTPNGRLYGRSRIPVAIAHPSRQPSECRCFHEYFITHLPSSSLHPDSRTVAGPHHKLPREKSVPHEPRSTNRTPAAAPPTHDQSRDMTVVRIPLKSAKHHFGVSLSRGSRPYNEDSYQAGTIEVPTFAKRQPMSLRWSAGGGIKNELTPAGSASGDPQVFYFGVFDGHGGMECSGFLREELHRYVEDAMKLFELESSLQSEASKARRIGWPGSTGNPDERALQNRAEAEGKESLDAIETHTPAGAEPIRPPHSDNGMDFPTAGAKSKEQPMCTAPPVKQSLSIKKAEELEQQLVKQWKELVGGYFRRFKPEYFSTSGGGQKAKSSTPDTRQGIGMETVLEYAFLKADLDFVSAQAGKQDEDPVLADKAINDNDILGQPSRQSKNIGGTKRFKGGSTCSIALISTPTPSPYWHPASPSTIITAHVGDTRILLCHTATGKAIPLTSNHHPSHPEEATRLRRFAATFVTDSFGEERVSGLANTRAFGDMASKRIGVSAEPEIRRVEISPAEYSFMVLISDGVSGHLSDQEIVDIVKEAKTPEQAAREVTSFATEVATDADNATTLVVRLGGWERRSEGGLGSLGTKEMRDWRKDEASDPRRGIR